jgi:high-affinity nickel-transport protein
MAGEIGLGLMGVGLGLGLRHGIDWDHIAAITDVTSAQPSRLRGLVMGSLYALGHAVVVVALGLLAILAFTRLPDWVDKYMEMVVGATLVTLGVWVFYSLLRNPDEFKLRSRWMLLFAAVLSVVRWVKARVSGGAYVEVKATPGYYGPGASTGIGMIHGIGAETGSQALVLAGAAGATSAAAGSFLLMAFIIGLIISNSLITIASTMGVLGSHTRRYLYIGLGTLIGSFSLVIGTLFLFQKGSLLPGFFA